MIAKQLSVYVENKPGKLVEKIKALADNKVDLRAMCIAESEDFGILRLIVSDMVAAKKALCEGSLLTETDVIVVETDNSPSALYNILDALSSAKINVEYMYAYTTAHSGANVVLRVKDCTAAQKALTAKGIK